jgi:membrane-associated phospholipid phosphatase
VYAALSVAQYRAVMSSGVQQANGEPGRGSVESERGGVAGASAQVLTFFFPAAAPALEQRVVAESEVSPGNVDPEFTRGLALGRAAGTAIVDRTKADRFTAPWTGTVPTGPGMWVANGPPAGPTFGGVTPYLLTSGSQFRSPPPPAFNSPAFLTDLGEIKSISMTRTPEQQRQAIYWNYPTGTSTPPGYWNMTTGSYVQSHGMNERGATRAFALTSVAMMDALIGCWEAKYYYWTLRPSHADPSITLSFALPNHPSYPSGHSCVSAAAATMLAYVFPDRTDEVNRWVTQAGLSRMYAGIHYRFDITAGANLGRAVGEWTIARDRQTGFLKALH